MSIFIKDPDAVLDYAFDWSSWLDAGSSEAISSYTIDADTGITVDSHGESSGVVTLWLSGGTDGTTYALRCEIVTDAGRTDQRTMIIKVQER
jgi:hypothetical protein